MDRRKFIVGIGALALTARAATAADKELYKRLTSNPTENNFQDGIGLKALAHATHIGEKDLPFVDFGEKTKGQVLMVDLANGIWVIRGRFEPGAEVTKHYHTGPVLAFTSAGLWHYKEYPEDVNVKGSFLYEPAHSLHTLTVPETNTEITDVWFAVEGANLNLDENNDVISVTDAKSVLDTYEEQCLDQKLNFDKLIVHGV